MSKAFDNFFYSAPRFKLSQVGVTDFLLKESHGQIWKSLPCDLFALISHQIRSKVFNLFINKPCNV